MGFEHIMHCILFVLIIYFFISFANNNIESDIHPIRAYGFFGTIVLYIIRLTAFLPLPQVILNFCGLILYDAFPKKVEFKRSLIDAPFLCLRVVTRGLYPRLVSRNLKRNLEICINVGLRNFIIEIVTDKSIYLPQNEKVREIVVPAEYNTKHGSLFKARALHYCWEENVNKLTDSDWIVHLDEETLLTEDSIKGILNFVYKDKHHFGQGLITYANDKIVNWFTTLADTYRVALDMGLFRFQLRAFHQAFYGWKGSFVVAKASAEKSVSYDNGPENSIVEDSYFAIKACSEGYSFDFIDGEMWETSPFYVIDLIRQRTRWIRGLLLFRQTPNLPIQDKIVILMYCYSWMSLPISLSNYFIGPFYPVPLPYVFELMLGFMGAVTFYMHIYGAMKSFTTRRFGYYKIIIILGTAIIVPINVILSVVTVFIALLCNEYSFYIIEKDMVNLKL